MDAARQVVRWSIPGWIFLFMLAVLQILTWLVEGRSVAEIAASAGPLLNTGAVAMVVTAGVPLGFILYQVYYSWYGTVLPFGFVNRDRGADILKALPEEQCAFLCSFGEHDLEEMSEPVHVFLLPNPLRRLQEKFRTADARKRFETKLSANWDLIRFWLQRIYYINKADILRAEVITLSDIYHGVGAARAALFLSCIVHLIVNVAILQHGPEPLWRMTVSIGTPYVFAFWLFRVFERARTAALSSLVSMLILALRTFSVTAPAAETKTA